MNAPVPHHLFCYGTLEFLQIMQSVVGCLFPALPAVLSGYRRLAINGEVFPGIVAQDGTEVGGTVYAGLKHGHLRPPDGYENAFYRRRRLRVRDAEDRMRTAWTFVVPEMYRHRLSASGWDWEASRSGISPVIRATCSVDIATAWCRGLM